MTKQWGVMSTLAVVAAIAALGVVPLAGQTAAAKPAAKAAKNYTPPKTPWGDPDLSGVYTNKDENGIPMEKPSQFEGKNLEEVDDSEFAEIVRARNATAQTRAVGIGGADTGAGPIHWYEHYDAKNSRPWLVIDPADGRIPPTTPDAQKRAADRAARRAGRGPADSYEDRSLYDQCITRGLPGSMTPAIYGNSYQIHQGQGWVAIRYEMIHEARIIPLDNRPHVGKDIALDVGDARGHWEGDTLVVETTNFTRRSAYRNANPEAFKLIERFKPIDKDTVEWSVTINDPSTWTRPWTYSMNLARGGADKQPFEYACHEGNYGMQNSLNAARKADTEAEGKK